MPGFESNRFTDLSESVAKHLICSICLNIFDNAVRSECEHTFCKSCVQNWIESNHKECPECREVFPTRKRTNTYRNDNNLVLVGSHVFKTNLMANSMISELTIKCDFDFNGCQQTIQLNQLSAHIKECEHRFCDNCGFTFGKTEEHNCIELLKNNRNDLKEKLEKQMEINSRLTEENSEFKTKLQTIGIKNSIKDNVINEYFHSMIGYTIIGSYKTSNNNNRIEINDLGIKLFRIGSNDGKKRKHHILIPFIECQQLMYCKDPSLQTIIIKPNESIGQKIRDGLYLGDNSPNEHKFDINSNDPKHRYIIVVVKSESKLFNLCVGFLESIKTNVEINEINRQSVNVMIETSVNNNH